MFVFALFNLQGTFAVRLAANFDILPHQKAFVKSYFQLFSNSFFEPLRSGLAEVLAYTIKSFAKCQALFSFFYDFFILSKPCVSSGSPTQNTVPTATKYGGFMCNPHNLPVTAASEAIHIPPLPLVGKIFSVYLPHNVNSKLNKLNHPTAAAAQIKASNRLATSRKLRLLLIS